MVLVGNLAVCCSLGAWRLPSAGKNPQPLEIFLINSKLELQLFFSPTPRSKNRNRSSHTDGASCSVHLALRKSPRTSCTRCRLAETRRHRSTSRLISLRPPSSLADLFVVRTLAWKPRRSDYAGHGDWSSSGGCPAKGDEDMSLRFLPGWSCCGVAEEQEEAGGTCVGDKLDSRSTRELFVVVDRYAIAWIPTLPDSLGLGW